MILILFIRYNREILMVKYAKPNQKLSFVRYNREIAITVIVITEFDCMLLSFSVCSTRKYCLYFEMSRLNSKEQKKSSFYSEKSLVGLTPVHV